MVKNISTTIKWKYLLPILLGVKTAEFKENTKFWETRLSKFQGIHSTGECIITFVCGRIVVKYEVVRVDLLFGGRDIDGNLCSPYWSIYLSNRVCTYDRPFRCVHSKEAFNLEGTSWTRCGSCDVCVMTPSITVSDVVKARQEVEKVGY